MIIIYAAFISIVYIRTLRLFSDSIYFEEKLKDETRKIIDESLEISDKKTENFVNEEYGITLDKYYYDDIINYKKIYIYPPKDNLRITGINKRIYYKYNWTKFRRYEN